MQTGCIEQAPGDEERGARVGITHSLRAAVGVSLSSRSGAGRRSAASERRLRTPCLLPHTGREMSGFLKHGFLLKRFIALYQ